MISSIKSIKAVGEYVLLRLEKIEKNLFEKSKSGIFVMPNTSTEKNFHRAYVHDIGPKVDKEIGFAIGDIVVFNDYDAKYVGDFDRGGMFIVLKATSVMAVYEEEKEENI